MGRRIDDRLSYWCNFHAALLSGTFVAAVANSLMFGVMAPFLAPVALPSEASLMAILGFAIKVVLTVPLTFMFFLAPSGVIAFVATLVFGSTVLLLVRKTRFKTVTTFAVAGFIVGYAMPMVIAGGAVVVSVADYLFAIGCGLSGLAGAYAFGYRICFPASTGCGSRPIPADEPLLSRIVRFLLVH